MHLGNDFFFFFILKQESVLPLDKLCISIYSPSLYVLFVFFVFSYQCANGSETDLTQIWIMNDILWVYLFYNIRLQWSYNFRKLRTWSPIQKPSFWHSSSTSWSLICKNLKFLGQHSSFFSNNSRVTIFIKQLKHPTDYFET